MRKMNGYKVAVPMVVGLALALGMLWGCGRKGEEKAAERVARVEVKESVPDLGTAERCMQGMMRDPKEAFHLSLMRKDDTAPPFTSEAEFTPETVEGTTKWITSQPPKQVSSAHGDLTAWGQAINTLLVPIEHRERSFAAGTTDGCGCGADPVNGYETVRYDFDTGRLPEADKARIAVTLQSKDFNVAGSAWLTRDTNCMVKFVSDDKNTSKSGMVGETHLEGSISRR